MLELINSMHSSEAADVTFNGIVSDSALISGTDLATMVGYTTGAAMNGGAVDWLSFNIDGKLIYISKKPVRSGGTWATLDGMGIVTGSKTVEIQGKTYKVRLLNGLSPNYTDTKDGYNIAALADTEWNRTLMEVFDGNSTSALDDTPPGKWPLFGDSDLGILSAGAGRFNLCMETANGDATDCTARGLTGISNLRWISKTATSANWGWRPVLELVP